MNLNSPFSRIFEWFIQKWLITTGKTCSLKEYPWLAAPEFPNYYIGEKVHEFVADAHNYKMTENQPGLGLIPHFSDLDSPEFNSSMVPEKVRHFYEHTFDYKMDVWSNWKGPFSFFAKILIGSISKDIGQLNIPFNNLDFSEGIENNIIHFTKENDSKHLFSCWLRKTLKNQKVVYAGFYGTVNPPGSGGKCINVIFPLPSGYSNVILRPHIEEDGSFSLISKGKKFGDPGYYRVHRLNKDKVKVRYLPLHERIHLYIDKNGDLRTDHTMNFFGKQFLHLHYKMSLK